MGKIIIYLADGTWDGPADVPSNGPGDGAAASGTRVATANDSNVLKLFRNLDGQPSDTNMLAAKEQESAVTGPGGALLQVAEYMHGVGDSNNILTQLLGGTFGAGIITRIVRGYTFVSRHYRAGDRIIIVGFSRGAYTARALAGLIAAKGLIDATKIDLTDPGIRYRLGAAVWYANRREVTERSNQSLFARLETFVADLPRFLIAAPPADQMIDAPIEAVAVWDTVGSLGIPQYTLDRERVDAFQFADLVLSHKVKYGIHALAVDEQRADFTPTLWNDDPRIVQTLFPGAHSDVGGGNKTANNESDLSDASLVWMSDQLLQLGVMFRTPPKYLPHPDGCSVAHQPWEHQEWQFWLKVRRSFRNGLTCSPSLEQRLKAPLVVAEPEMQPHKYDPPNLRNYVFAT